METHGSSFRDGRQANPHISIRQYRDEDHSAVCQLLGEGLMLFDSEFDCSRGERRRMDLTNDCAACKAASVATDGGNLWVATATAKGSAALGDIVGVIWLQHRFESEGEVRRLFVDTGCHRMGVGRRLLRQLEHWATRNDYEMVSLRPRGSKL